MSKSMNHKRILGLLMAGAMTFSNASVGLFASESDSTVVDDSLGIEEDIIVDAPDDYSDADSQEIPDSNDEESPGDLFETDPDEKPLVFTVTWNAGEGTISDEYSDDPSVYTEEYSEGENLHPFLEQRLIAPEKKVF